MSSSVEMRRGVTRNLASKRRQPAEARRTLVVMVNDESGWVEAEMILATDTLLDTRHGPVQLPVETLRQLAEQMNQEQRHMTAQHDPSRPLRIRNQRADVEQAKDGKWLLKMRAEVYREDWDQWQALVAAAGAPGGMSIGVTQPIRVEDNTPGLVITGDAADFPDDDLLDLAADAPDEVPVNVARLYQFAADPEAVRLIIEFTASVVAGVSTNLLYNWLKRTVRRLRDRGAELNRRSALDVRFRQEPNGAVEFEARTWLDDDEKVVETLDLIMDKLNLPRGEDSEGAS